ncbi:MFS general substrate transporter [Tilletiaria anomala UBC 951]|uniref:MFS general substrate transporter n=1 Tax=Tilletiaria anomala (strain ATCC 24038 / CBS 436.72 / UBC 951) TaxID=1037660 RepID=A0A066V668_TILAU|nr:MFS general substrate transporter [Tilletiaria anomala UBC 951]KDN35743.1 MFS general substrate transporter [Tilletiaria anomala UBC 951]
MQNQEIEEIVAVSPPQYRNEGISSPPSAQATYFWANVDGGLLGWLTVTGAWLLQFAMVGAVTSFGSYQTFYQNIWLSTYSSSSIAWIGSLQLFLEFFLGVFGGFLLDAGRFRVTIACGTLLFIFAFFMLSLCQAGMFAPILLSQGIGMGAGLGLAYLPVSGVVSQHFNKRRGLAMGVITTGSSLGGFAFSVLASKLFQPLGFGWTVRVCAFIVLGCLAPAFFLIKEPVRNGEKEAPHQVQGKIECQEDVGKLSSLGNSSHDATPPPTIRSLLLDPAYVATISSGFVVCLGLYYPMFAIEAFALDRGIHPDLASWLLSLLNVSSVLGRLIPNYLADHWGMYELYVPCTAAAAALLFAFPACTTASSIVVFAILYGFFSGSIVSLYFPTVSSLDPQVASTGLRLGLACMPVGIASLVGTPIAEALVGSGKPASFRRWPAGAYFGAAAEIFSAVLLAGAWLSVKRRSRPAYA